MAAVNQTGFSILIIAGVNTFEHFQTIIVFCSYWLVQRNDRKDAK